MDHDSMGSRLRTASEDPRADARYDAEMTALCSVHLLVIDDLALESMSREAQLPVARGLRSGPRSGPRGERTRS
jgi:hypothetical protein